MSTLPSSIDLGAPAPGPWLRRALTGDPIFWTALILVAHGTLMYLNQSTLIGYIEGALPAKLLREVSWGLQLFALGTLASEVALFGSLWLFVLLGLRLGGAPVSARALLAWLALAYVPVIAYSAGVRIYLALGTPPALPPLRSGVDLADLMRVLQEQLRLPVLGHLRNAAYVAGGLAAIELLHRGAAVPRRLAAGTLGAFGLMVLAARLIFEA
jgi:hypothetical protein